MIDLVGILNVTPDSFSDGGQFLDPDKAILQAKQLITDGAAIIDIGAESTKPGATPLTHEQEWSRLEPILTTLLPLYPGMISLDSYHPETIRKAYTIGPVIVNDITGLHNPDMIQVILDHGARCIISHIHTPDIQRAHSGSLTSDIKAVKHHLLEKESALVASGLAPENIILDPGIGFGKTPELNLQLLEFAKHVSGKQVMIGYSRKRFLGKRRMQLEPNLEAARTAITSGATYLRVHDVIGHSNALHATTPST